MPALPSENSPKTARISSPPILPGNRGIPRPSARCRAILLLCATATVLPATALRGLADAADLKSISTSAEAYAVGIRTLKGRYAYRSYSDPTMKSNTNLMRHTVEHDLTFTVDVRQGWNHFDERSAFLLGPAKAALEIRDHMTYSFNGKQIFKLAHTHASTPIEKGAPRDIPHELNISRGVPIDPGFKPWELAGLALPHQSASLATLLAEPGIQILKNEKVEGVDCVHVKTANGLGEFWLDPTHDLLPLRAHLGRTRNPSSGKEGPAEELTVLEFRKFRAAGRSKGEFWFPVRGQVTNCLGMIHDIAVTDLEINPEVDPGDFMIDEAKLPAGVKVFDRTGSSPSQRFTGDASDEWASREEAIQREDEEIQKRVAQAVIQFGLPSPGNSPTGTASSPPGFLDQINPSAALAAVGAFVLVATSAVILKSRAKR